MQTYSDEIKAQVIAEWHLGAAVAALARKHKIPRSTVRAWTTGLTTTAPVVAIQKREDLGLLVYEYLATGLKALIAQAGAMGDTEWFKKQGESTYLIHGTLADKLVIVFGGVERGQEPDSDQSS